MRIGLIIDFPISGMRKLRLGLSRKTRNWAYEMQLCVAHESGFFINNTCWSLLLCTLKLQQLIQSHTRYRLPTSALKPTIPQPPGRASGFFFQLADLLPTKVSPLLAHAHELITTVDGLIPHCFNHYSFPASICLPSSTNCTHPSSTLLYDPLAYLPGIIYVQAHANDPYLSTNPRFPPFNLLLYFAREPGIITDNEYWNLSTLNLQ